MVGVESGELLADVASALPGTSTIDSNLPHYQHVHIDSYTSRQLFNSTHPPSTHKNRPRLPRLYQVSILDCSISNIANMSNPSRSRSSSPPRHPPPSRFLPPLPRSPSRPGSPPWCSICLQPLPSHLALRLKPCQHTGFDEPCITH